jgi:SHS2 domain-containing protein
MTRPAYRLIDHTADMAFEVEAATWEGLLGAATAAVSDIVLAVGESPEPRSVEREVEVAGADREDVLVAWLNEVVVLFEDEGFLAREVRIDRAEATAARGVLLGRLLDLHREVPDRVIKAVTYHDLRIAEGGAEGKWKAAVVLDL